MLKHTFSYRKSYLVWVLGIALTFVEIAHAQPVLFTTTPLQFTTGIEADRAGNVYVDSDGTFTTYVTKFSPNGTPIARTTLGNITVGNLGRIVRVPNTDSMLLLTSRGQIYIFGPNLPANLNSNLWLDVSPISYRVVNNVYDVNLKGVRSLVLGAVTWGDIAAFWARTNLLYLYITANNNANGQPFVLRVAIDFNQNPTSIQWRIIAQSVGTTAGSVNQTRGIAVNSAGWVLTTFPFAVGSAGFADSLVAFRTSFPETNTLAVAPRFVLTTNTTRTGLHDMASVGMTADAAGNFYVASGLIGSSLCGFYASSALVLINPVPTTPNPRCFPLPALLAPSADVAVNPVGNIPYLTTGSYILKFNRLVQ